MSEWDCIVRIFLFGGRSSGAEAYLGGDGGGVDIGGIVVRFALGVESFYLPNTREGPGYSAIRVYDGKRYRIENEVFNTDYEDFSTILYMKIRESDVIMFCYSITSRSSFEDLARYHADAIRGKDSDSFPMLLVATTCDEEEKREVSTSEGEKLAESWGCPFFEVSAKTNLRVEDVFHQAVLEWLRFKDPSSLPLSNDNEAKKRKCILM